MSHLYKLLGDDAENLLLRGVQKEVIAGHHAELKRARGLLSPSCDSLFRGVRIVQTTECRNRAVECGLLWHIFCFSEEQQKQACGTFYQLKNGFGMGNVDARVLFAAFRMTYEDNPDEFISKNYSHKMLAHFENQVIERGVRARELLVSKEQIRRSWLSMKDLRRR